MSALSFEAFHHRLGRPGRVMILAPHPDDETCGTGGLIALCAAAGIALSLVLVTDGEASHRHSPGHPPDRLRRVRRAELERALRTLGAPMRPQRLGLPDGDCEKLGEAELTPARRRLAAAARRFEPDLILAPWRGDPHGDHKCAASLAAAVAPRVRARLAHYDVWTRLSGTPGPAPGEAQTVSLDILAVRALKRRALACHASQLGRRIHDDPGGFALAALDRRRLLRPAERYFL